jgi:hypothetical protein
MEAEVIYDVSGVSPEHNFDNTAYPSLGEAISAAMGRINSGWLAVRITFDDGSTLSDRAIRDLDDIVSKGGTAYA